MKITAALLTARDACASPVRTFRKLFPEGAEYPRDLAIAVDAGLDVSWVEKAFGLLPPIHE